MILLFDDWWACKNCKAKGPELNKRHCPNASHSQTYKDEDDSGHKHTIRKIEEETLPDEDNDEGNKGT
eukprot:2256240-Heterocapsa_arctica.AAC.2